MGGATQRGGDTSSSRDLAPLGRKIWSLYKWGRLRLQRVWICGGPGQAYEPPPDFGPIFAVLKGEPQGPLGVEAFQGLLWPRGRGGRLGLLGGLARGRGFRRPRPGPAPAAMRPARTALWLRLVVALGLALVGPLPVGWSSARAPIYVSSWAVRVSQGYQEAERLARKFGFVNLGQVGRTQMDRKVGG